MYFVSFNVDCGERSCRTQVLAGTAAYAPFLIDCRNHQRLRIIRILPYHPDGSARAVTCAVAAADFVSIHDAVVKIYNCVSDLDGRLLLPCYRSDGSGWTDV